MADDPKQDAQKPEARRIKIPVTKLTALFLAASDFFDSKCMDNFLAEVGPPGNVPEHEEAHKALKDFTGALEKAYDAVFQTHWGGEVYDEAVATTNFMLQAAQQGDANNEHGNGAPGEAGEPDPADAPKPAQD